MPKHTANWYYTETNPITPKTTTQEMLETGRLGCTRMHIIVRKELNFQSYPMTDRFIVDGDSVQKKIAWTTSYRRDFVSYFPKACLKKVEIETIPDPLFNRRCISDFPLTISSPHKFMDDHFVNLSENRKKINFLRQLRNTHFNLS